MTDSPAVTLRGQRSDDWDMLYALLNHEAVVPFTDELPYISDDAFRDRYMGTEPGLYRLVGEITLPSGRSRFVGMAQLQVQKWRRRHVGELRFAVYPDYYGTDVEASFVAQVIAFGEEWLALRRLQIIAYPNDGCTLALLEQHNFACEATLRRYAFRRGTYADACLMARLVGVGVQSAVQVASTTAAAGDVASETADSVGRKTNKKSKSGAVTVRGMEASDWEDCAEIVRGESVYSNTLQLPYLSRDITRERMENPPDDVHFLAAVIDEQVVGMLGLHVGSDMRAHAADLGMMVHEAFQGRGVGPALMQAAVELAEEWLNISRMSLEVFVDNAAGLVLYRKFGFEIEGTMRRYAYRAGEYVDTYLMARIRGDSTE